MKTVKQNGGKYEKKILDKNYDKWRNNLKRKIGKGRIGEWRLLFLFLLYTDDLILCNELEEDDGRTFC